MVVPVSMSTAFQAAKEIASDLDDAVDEDDIRRVQIHYILILCQFLSRLLNRFKDDSLRQEANENITWILYVISSLMNIQV